MKNILFILTMLGLTSAAFSMELPLEIEFFAAAKKGNIKKLIQLLDQGADIDSRGEYDQSALSAAIENRHIDAVKFLLENGADPNAADNQAITPLMDAVELGDFEICKLLLDHGAQVNRYPGIQIEANPFMIAVRNGYTEIVELFLNHHTDINLLHAYDVTALMIAAQCQRDQVVKLLIERGANIYAVDADGQTALVYAATASDNIDILLSILTTLSDQETQMIKEDIYGITGVHFAQPRLPKDVRKLITAELINSYVQEHMKKIIPFINQPDRDGRTARDVALANDNARVAELLDLNNPASIEIIRQSISNNIKRILFGEPVRRERTIENNWQEALGEWFEQDENE